MSENTNKPVCVIAFFGIDRRLDITAPTIIKNIIKPAQKYFDVRLKAHLWTIDAIDNERSGESGTVAAPRLSLLPEGAYVTEPPEDWTQNERFNALQHYGDFWQDDFRSFSNLFSQLTSLQRVTEAALKEKPHTVCFIRPDLFYHHSLEAALEKAAESSASQARLYLPHWQPHGGLNDRFAICAGTSAITAYGQRGEQALAFCQASNHPLHSEKLVHFALNHASITVEKIAAQASRVRINGNIKAEDFSYYGWKPWLRSALGKLKPI